MDAVLARERPMRPPPEVDTLDLPFATVETPSGPLHVRTYRVASGHRMGRARSLGARDASAEVLALLALDPSLAPCDPRGALYLDTETTGLSGGTGTVAFLVGLAFFEGDALFVEQILVRALGEEAPMLERVAARIRNASMLVTFNGKSFDLPLLRTRFVLARIGPVAEPPHLDLLHVARRLHKARGIECRLTGIEKHVLGFERVGDVPSGEVCGHYLHFLRTGDAGALMGVVEHNAWDVVAMAALVGLYGEPLVSTELDPDDLVGVARTLKRAGELEQASGIADLAVERGAGVDSLRARGEISKARGERAKALADFESLAAAVDDPRARLELAKLYEHFVKEPARALAILEGGVAEGVDQTLKRKARLAGKVDRARQGRLPGVGRKC
jgi:hypothetical protein